MMLPPTFMSVIYGLLCVGLFVRLTIGLKRYFVKWIIFSKIPGPPEPALPFIGHALTVRGDPEEFYYMLVKRTKEQLIARGLEVAHGWIGTVPVVTIAGPNSAEVLLHSSQHMKKTFLYTFLHSWLGTGLLTAAGEKWKSRRKLLTPTFHFSILQDFIEVMNEQAVVFTTKLDELVRSKEIFNIFNPITLCALDVICETAMGKTIHAQDSGDSDYVKAIYRNTEIIQDRQKSPWLWPNFVFDWTTKGKEYARNLKILHNFTRSVIRDKMESLKNKGHVPTNKRMAFLDLLLNVSQDGEVLSFNDIQEEVDTFMFEGHDTTAAAMTWAVHLIGTRPDIQSRIQKELDEIFGDNYERKVSMEDVRKMEYLEMVVKECLRLFPSVPIIGRVTSSDCVMDGHHIPAGTDCLLFPQVINTSEQYWENPDRFDPERFTSENSADRHPYAYVPFSAGPRNCIGQRFALIEEKVILAHLLRKYTVESQDLTGDLRLMSDIILRPRDGIRVKLIPRLVPGG